MATSCIACPNVGSLRCSRCKSVSYCSTSCQKAHWKVHKRNCIAASDTSGGEDGGGSGVGDEITHNHDFSTNSTAAGGRRALSSKSSQSSDAIIGSSKKVKACKTAVSDLIRFVDAQGNGVYEEAESEMKNGQKTTHWIWFILPQRTGLGFSSQSQFFGLKSDQEIIDYINHPSLGPRYFAIVSLIHDWIVAKKRKPTTLMGSEIDVIKMKSSLGTFFTIANTIEPKTESLVLFIQQADELARHLGWAYVS